MLQATWRPRRALGFMNAMLNSVARPPITNSLVRSRFQNRMHRSAKMNDGTSPRKKTAQNVETNQRTWA